DLAAHHPGPCRSGQVGPTPLTRWWLVFGHVVGVSGLGAGAARVAVLPTGFAPGAAALGLGGGLDQAVGRRGLGGVTRAPRDLGFQLKDPLVRVLQLGPQLHDQRGELLVGGRALVGGGHGLIVAGQVLVAQANRSTHPRDLNSHPNRWSGNCRNQVFPRQYFGWGTESSCPAPLSPHVFTSVRGRQWFCDGPTVLLRRFPETPR